MTRRRMLRGGVLLIGLALPALLPAPAFACSMMAGQGMRRLDEVPLLAIATPRVLPAGRGVPTEIADVSDANSVEGRARIQWANQSWWSRIQAWFRGERPPPPRSPSTALPVGQVVRVVRFAGPDSARIAAALTRSGGEVVVVRWLQAPNCGPRLNESRSAFLPPDEAVFAIGRLRPLSGWVGARPTFDVLAGRRMRPLAWPDSLGPRQPEPPLTYLAPADYFELYRLLPREDSIPLDTTQALRPLRRWLAAHPALRTYEEAIWEQQAVKMHVRWAADRAGSRRR